jgi:hypothetical protein
VDDGSWTRGNLNVGIQHSKNERVQLIEELLMSDESQTIIQQDSTPAMPVKHQCQEILCSGIKISLLE